MSALLTYHVRRGQLSAVASGKIFHLPTDRDPSRVAAWEKGQELRSGRYTLWDYCFELPHQHVGRQASATGVLAGKVIPRVKLGSANTSKLELYDYPGEYAQRFDGISKGGDQHSHSGKAVYVGDQRSGVYIHGWPPCNCKRCVVVMRQWEDVLQAIAGEKELAFAIEY